MTATTIEWTDEVWNPVTGCTKVSPGCDHCYAERITERFHGKGSFERVILHPERLAAPLHWRRPRRVFVNSMSDLFHVDVPMGFLERVWQVMEVCPEHVFQVLTKRAERMERVVPRLASLDDGVSLSGHIWLGVSVEAPAYYARIRHLQGTPAAVRFLSCEPLLAALPDLPLAGIDWVIVGGESGPGARPIHPDWVRDIRDQCARAGVAFFFKQWGEWVDPEFIDSVGWDDVVMGERGKTLWPPGMVASRCGQGTSVDGSVDLWHVGKHRAGRTLDGRTWDEYPVARPLELREAPV